MSIVVENILYLLRCFIQQLVFVFVLDFLTKKKKIFEEKKKLSIEIIKKKKEVKKLLLYTKKIYIFFFVKLFNIHRTKNS